MRARRRNPFSLFLLLCPLCLACGACRNTNQQILELELQARERDVRELREELSRLECFNESLQREASAAHQHGGVRAAPEFAAQTYTLRKLALGRGTGGVDEDHRPGDEGLLVVLEPRDCDDHVIKAPGQVQVTALEITPEGIKAPLSTWDVPPEQLRKSWRTGLFSTGYFLKLPWNAGWPTNQQLRVVVRLQTADGRVFEADRDIRVQVAAAAPHHHAAPLEVIPGPAPGTPPVEETLPKPRPLDTPEPSPPPPAPPPSSSPSSDPGPVFPSVSRRVPVEADSGWRPAPLDGVRLKRPVPMNP